MEASQNIKSPPGLTVEKFIEYFRKCHHWKCEPGTRITNDLTKFASEREGSRRNIDELYVIFCIAHGLRVYPPQDPEANAALQNGGGK